MGLWKVMKRAIAVAITQSCVMHRIDAVQLTVH